MNNKVTPNKKNTRIEGLAYSFIYLPITLRKTYRLRHDQKPIQREYIKSKSPKSQNAIVFYKVLNKIKYILVAIVTVGGTFIPIKTGLKTMPPQDP
jgi:hypothetical protein